MELKNNSVITYSTIITASVLTGIAVISLQTKFIFALIMFFPVSIYWIKSSEKSKIVLTILSITFTITLQFLGKDAVTTGTLLIFLHFFWYCSKYNAHKYILNQHFLKLLIVLIIISLIGFFTEVPMKYYGHAVREFIGLLSSFLLFYIIIFSNSVPAINEDNIASIDFLISIFLLIFAIHIILSILFYYFPFTQSYFQIFFNRTQTHITGQIDQYGDILRASSIFAAGEQYGELVAVLYPFLLYKCFKSDRKKIYTLLLLLYVFAIGLSATRSAAILVMMASIVIFTVNRVRKYSKRKKYLFTLLVILAISSIFFSFDIFHIFTDRFQTSLNQIKSEDNLISVLNRQAVWPIAWDTTKNTLSLFGHGPVEASQIGYNVPHFHCLYLTLIFQFGIIGTTLFLYLFYWLLRKFIINIIKSNKNSDYCLLNYICLISLSVFLINEVKYEFTRGASYQQYIWGIMGIYYLVATYIPFGENYNNEKDVDNQSQPVRLPN